MVYSEQFVAAIKVNSGTKLGQILRETKDGCVHIPFGTEYSIYMKNLSSKRSVVSITIDGVSVGESLVIGPNESCDLERFIDGRTKGYKFKFIEKTQEISEHRGDRIDDGIVRIDYQYESVKLYTPQIKITEEHHYHHYPHDWNWPTDYWKNRFQFPYEITYGSSTLCSSGDNIMMDGGGNSSTAIFQSSQNQDGITVQGGDSSQNFYKVHVGNLEQEKHVIVLKLVGASSEECGRIEEPVTVKMKCPTCGKTTKARWCGNCGTRVRE